MRQATRSLTRVTLILATVGLSFQQAAASPQRSATRVSAAAHDGPLQLLATIQRPGRPLALVRAGRRAPPALVAAGQRFDDKVRLLAVFDGRVLLDNNHKLEYLGVGTSPKQRHLRPAGGVQSSKVGPSARPVGQPTGVRRIGAMQFVIDRDFVRSVRQNPTMLARSGMIMPVSRNGKPAGFELRSVRPGGLYARIGLRARDTLESINGRQIATTDQVLTILPRLSNARHITLGVRRRGKRIAIDYRIE